MKPLKRMCFDTMSLAGKDAKLRMKRDKTKYSFFDKLASEYDTWFDNEGKLIFFIETQAFRSILPCLPEPWVEIGVGSGRFAQALGIQTGIDPSIELARMARKRGINVYITHGENQLFDEESFGTVFLIVTLCFVDSPLDVLNEIKRILIPGGKLVLGLVLKESPWGKYYQQKKAEGHRFYKSATFYSYEDVVKLLVQIGFTTEQIISTLFQQPDKVAHLEDSKMGYFPDAGFTIIMAKK